jgi:hypothetical protein
MKKLLSILGLFTLLACSPEGTTTTRLTGDENTLPNELKGLKVYDVSLGNGDYVKVAVLNNNTNSTTYRDGKIDKNIIVVDRRSQKVINVEDIIMENDSLIICRK